MVEQSLTAILQDECSCDFSVSDLKDTNLDCSKSGKRVSFSTTLTYSSEDGSITANTLIKLIQRWHSDTKDPTIDLEGQTVAVSQVCSPTCTSEDDSDTGTIVGLFAGGLLAGIFLVAIPVIIIW